MQLFDVFSKLGLRDESEVAHNSFNLSFSSIVTSISEAITNFSIALNEAIIRASESPLWKGLVDAGCMYKLYDIGYPPCVHLSQAERDEISDLLTYNGDALVLTDEIVEKVVKLIFKSYDESKMVKILESWKNSPQVKQTRLIALEEAINAYNDGRYYSCVAIIMCQIEGIIKDNQIEIDIIIQSPANGAAKDRYAKLYAEHEDELNKCNKLEYINTPKKRGERQLLMNFTYVNVLFWSYFTEYVYRNIDSDTDDRILNHPNRNKICHGVDENFGTQEKALKSILCLDALIMLTALKDVEEENYSDE